MNNTGQKIGYRESNLLLALLISLTAFAIDAMLPALPAIGDDLKVPRPNDVQLIIAILILGLSAGQIIYGPLSDSKGRKPVLCAGVIIFLSGCTLSLFSTTFEVMLAGRFIQGLGLAGPRSVVVALIRDQYEGRTMAGVMSTIMAVFIVVPAIAPAIGQAIFLVTGWRSIFSTLLLYGLIALAWFVLRQHETLRPERRLPFSFKQILRGTVEVCRNRTALGYTIVTGFIQGAFLGYLNSAQQIFQNIYGLGNRFPLFFATLSLAIGLASLLNARIVMRYGMRVLTVRAMQALAALTIAYLVLLWFTDGRSALWLLMVCLMPTFFCFGVLFGNLNAIAMKPLGHIAGIGSAVVGSLSSLISVPLAVLIGNTFNGTIVPLIAGFALLSLLSLVVMRWAAENTIK